MSSLRVVLLISLLAIATSPLPAQTPEGTDTYSDSIKACSRLDKSLDRAKSYTDFLRAHGVEISEPSLIAALQNDIPEIRMNAVVKLLADCDLHSIPAIEKALSTEEDNTTRANIAGALASFGDPVGAKYLAAACTDPSLPTLAMSAAVHGLALAHYSHPQFTSPAVCADTVLNLFDSRPDSKIDMIELFAAMYHEVSQSQADRMVADAQSLLQSDNASSRMAGSDVLASLGSTASIDLIRSTMERETEPAIRSVLQESLDTLMKLQQSAAPAAPANPPH
ncbi:MAG: HEAT repeat domain-containing protein [Acidobacteriaceae bacterium]